MKIICFLGLLLAIWGCSTKPACYNDTNKNQIIRWGTFYAATNTFDAYEINSAAEISSYTKADRSDLTELGQADVVRFCPAIRSIKSNLLKTQAYSTPGDTLLFIELNNKNTDLQMRFSWNYSHVNTGNKLCIEALDSLNALRSSIK